MLIIHWMNTIHDELDEYSACRVTFLSVVV